MFTSSVELILGAVELNQSLGLIHPALLLAPLPQALAATIPLYVSVSLTVLISHSRIT